MSDLLPRGFRFSHKDKSLLAKLVGNYPAILYKGLDAESLSKKMTAWEELTRRFNAKNDGHEFTFTPRHLKALWKRMKLQSKKAAAAQQGADRTNGSPIPELGPPNLEVRPILLHEAEQIIPEEPSSPYIYSCDPPSPASYVLPDDPPTLVDSSNIYSVGKQAAEDSQSPAPSPTPPIGEFLSHFLTNGEKVRRKKPIHLEMDDLHEEHKLRMECLRLDREIKILKKWKLQNEILSTGYDLPPKDFS